MYRLSTSSKVVCKKLYKFIYEDSYFYLNRKFEKFSHYVNTEESQLIAEFRNAQQVNVNESNNPTTSLEHPSKDDDIC